MTILRLMLVLCLVATACTTGSGDGEPNGGPSDAAAGENPLPTSEQAVSEPAASPSDSTPEPATEEPETEQPEVEDNGAESGELPTSSEIRDLGTEATCGHYPGEEDFCEDSDGDRWPDFIEVAVGRDPLTDDCAAEGCDTGELEDFLAQAQANTLFILDASGSMAGDAGAGQTKMEAAKEAMIRYVTATPDFIDIGLLVYGHEGDNTDAGRPESCTGIETFAPIGELNYQNVEEVVGQFQPTGWTPIAGSLAAAAAEFEAAIAADEADGTPSSNRIVVISDGLETCDGNPVAAAQGLLDQGISVVIDVIGFDLAESDRASLEQVAEVTGGTYSDARTGADLLALLDQYSDQSRRVLEAASCNNAAAGDQSSCNADLRGDISVYGQDQFLPAVRDEHGPEARTFAANWLAQAQRENRDAYSVRTDELRARYDELFALFEEADERRAALGDRIGEKARKPYVPFDCPYSTPHTGE